MDFLSSHSNALLICRIPTSEQHNLYRLNQMKISYLVADTLVYYEADIQNKIISPLKNNLIFDEGSPMDKISFDSLVSEIFKNYTNHYFSNPMLDKDKIIEGYQEWVGNYYMNTDNTVEKVAFLVSKGDNLVGFATCSNEDVDVAEGVLFGVKPSASGEGIYTDIMRFTQAYYRDKGIKKMKVSTQIQNYAVQKAWIKEGFKLKESFITLHIFNSEMLEE